MAFGLNKELIQSIRKIGQNYAVDQIVLFGSRARGDHRPTSDIDLAVFLSPESNSKGRLASEFDDLNTLLKIDTIFVNENIDPELLKNIKKDGVFLYERAIHKT